MFFPRQFFARALLLQRLEQAIHLNNIVSSDARVARAIRRENKGRDRKDSSLFPLPLAHVLSRGPLALLATRNREV